MRRDERYTADTGTFRLEVVRKEDHMLIRVQGSEEGVEPSIVELPGNDENAAMEEAVLMLAETTGEAVEAIVPRVRWAREETD